MSQIIRLIDQQIIKQHYTRKEGISLTTKIRVPVSGILFDDHEISRVIKTMKDGLITQGKMVNTFEKNSQNTWAELARKTIERFVEMIYGEFDYEL